VRGVAVRLHLDALILLHRVWGAFGVLTGTALGLLAVGTNAARQEGGVPWL
jgi:hypothetical protein